MTRKREQGHTENHVTEIGWFNSSDQEIWGRVYRTREDRIEAAVYGQRCDVSRVGEQAEESR